MKWIIIGVAGLLLTACAPAQPQAEEKAIETNHRAAPIKDYAQPAHYTAFFNRGDIVENSIKKVDMVITRSDRNPFEQEDEERVSGIYSTYYFNLDGLLQAENSGNSSTHTQYIYDNMGQVTQHAWSDGLTGELENIRPSDDFINERMKWEFQGDRTKPMTLSVLSACYGVTAEYEFVLEQSASVPMSGKANFVRNLYHEGGAKEPQETLNVFFKYEFYDY